MGPDLRVGHIRGTVESSRELVRMMQGSKSSCTGQIILGQTGAREAHP